MKYETTKVKFVELEKKLNRLFKKMDVLHISHTFTKLNEFVKEVPVYTIDPITKSTRKVDSMMVECVEFDLDFDEYKVGNYRLGAVLERTMEDDNLVYAIDDEFDYAKYKTEALRCDHCRRNNNRTKAVVIIDNETGNEIMVGKTCLKDFIGVRTDSFAGYLYSINEILNDINEEILDTEMHLYNRCFDTIDYLARCIKMTEDKGYFKTMKEDAIFEAKKSTTIEQKYIDKAKEVAKFFETYETEDSFEHNIRLYVTGRMPIVRENGFVAYAYTLYKKIIEGLAEKAKMEEAAKNSNYVGTVGEKITVNAEMNLVGGYDTEFGYVRIYKFVDESGNIYIWKTSTAISLESGSNVTLKGTIKNHKEYKLEKQTVLTRCKVCAA